MLLKKFLRGKAMRKKLALIFGTPIAIALVLVAIYCLKAQDSCPLDKLGKFIKSFGFLVN